MNGGDEESGFVSVEVDLRTAIICNQQGIDALHEAGNLVEELKESYAWDSRLEELYEAFKTVAGSIGFLQNLNEPGQG